MDNKQIMQIQCPGDGAILSIAVQPNLETKNVTCPVCKQSRPFTAYKKLVPKPAPVAGNTVYPGMDQTQYGGVGKTQYGGKEQTQYGGNMSKTVIDDPNTCVNLGNNGILGRLTVVGTRQSLQLRPGRTVVGRKASNSTAAMQIETGASRRMSRNHVAIDVAKVPGQGYVHTVKLCKELCNATFVNNNKLEPGDCIILQHGDTIRLPDADLLFTLPDSEATDI